MKTLDQVRKGLPAERRERIAARTEELILEEYALRRMRKARQLTQERMAELLGVRQDSISRLERRSDLLLSTLKSYVEAMGGSLQLVVKFKDEQTVALPSLVEAEEDLAPHEMGNVCVHSVLARLTSWVSAEISATANSNCLTAVHAERQPCPIPQELPNPYGPIMIYRYDAGSHCKGRGWGRHAWQGHTPGVCW